MKHRRRAERGFNLPEVLIAMALLGTVLLSIVTLFFLGRGNVYSGKQMTRANSVTVHAHEDLAAMTARQIFEAFSITDATTTDSHTVAGVTYDPSIVVSTDDLSIDAKGYLARWKALLPQSRIASGRVSIVLLPSQIPNPADITTARVIRIRIVTEWNEATRARQVSLDTVKFNRSLGV